MNKDLLIAAKYWMIFIVIGLMAFKVSWWIIIPLMIVTLGMFLYRTD